MTTNTAGRYTFVNLRPGDYEVTITKTGFSKVSIPSDVIEVGETSTNNVTLKVGSESPDRGSAEPGRGIADPERHRRQHGHWTCA